ncbi:hypothetical protein B1H10_03175 [candidate division KSB1 bacterium 4484_188]|nr:MAG: hypothetical protein B1H10_03175 [candidate division KSB1 bacterium 4484_188]HFE63256.1 type II toxin-antitoxin system RelE/ParE family toxin [Caldithrix sp.]
MTNSGRKFEIFYAKSVKSDLDKIAKQDLPKIKLAIEKLQDFPNISNIKKLTAHPLADFRLRVGNYRLLFDVEWENKKIYILKIGHRKDVY